MEKLTEKDKNVLFGLSVHASDAFGGHSIRLEGPADAPTAYLDEYTDSEDHESSQPVSPEAYEKIRGMISERPLIFNITMLWPEIRMDGIEQDFIFSNGERSSLITAMDIRCGVGKNVLFDIVWDLYTRICEVLTAEGIEGRYISVDLPGK